MTAGYLALSILLLCLLLLSIFFSGTETGMMVLDRYRLRHLAAEGDQGAQRIAALLKRPDRLLGVILIGNTVANVFAASVTTLIAAHFYGEIGVAVATVLLTFFILIFAETAPKTLAALYPERVAWPASIVLTFLLKVLYPLVWLANGIANGLLRLFGVKLDVSSRESLSVDELRSVLREAKGKISANYKKMLLRILDLEIVAIEDIMVPRNEIFGIDLNWEWDHILTRIMECSHTFVPLYCEDINHVQGMLNLRKVLVCLRKKDLNKEQLIALADEVYFVPEEASANQQLSHFRQQKQNIGLVVDEYGDIQGLITLHAILEEIVVALNKQEGSSSWVTPQKDGSFLVNAGVDVRHLNEVAQWDLPIGGPRTLSGLVIEHLEMIPISGICTRVEGYPMEIIRVSHNTIKLMRIWPK